MPIEADRLIKSLKSQKETQNKIITSLMLDLAKAKEGEREKVELEIASVRGYIRCLDNLLFALPPSK